MPSPFPSFGLLRNTNKNLSPERAGMSAEMTRAGRVAQIIFSACTGIYRYSCGSAQTRCRRISTERHFYAHKIKKKVTTPFFLRVKARRIFIHINWRHPYLWEQTFYEKVLRRLQVPIHIALEQCLPTRNGRTRRRRSLGGIFFSSGKQHEKFLPFHSRGWGPAGIWRRFIGLFIDTAADFMHCIHHMNTFEGAK